MLLTKIEPIKKELYRIEFDYEFVFALYSREIKQFHLEEGIEVSDELVTLIEREIVIPRARKKAMMLLKYSDRTKEELRKKLLEASFSASVAEEALSYVESYGYVDDARYIENYVTFKKDRKSKKQIELELLQKGVQKEEVIQYLEDNEWNESEVLKKLVEKRLLGKVPCEPKEMQKHYQYFLRKGYSYSLVKKVIEEYLEEYESMEEN